ncbi:MAG: hypothetical protein IH945_09110 [Armatimonadetes bacterium]|nr:hypothetical protein [Armatimonadota bacterium]
MSEEKKDFWVKLQEIDRRWLYAILLVLTSAGLFIPAEIPITPDRSSIDLYISLSEVPEGETILVQSDWTNSTRGENAGQFEAMMRFMMAKRHKFVIYTYGDPQAPQVSRDALARILEEREKAGLYEYKEWDDYLIVGYFPNAEAQTVALDNDIRTAWDTKKIFDPGTQTDRSPFESPVLKDIYSVNDVGFLMIITASGTIDVAVERLSDNPLKLGCMCTGVVGPQVLPYHQAKQVVGISIGLKGVYDFEYMMKYGVNFPGEDGELMVTYHKDRDLVIEPIAEGITFSRGKTYYPPLHVALTLLILAVIVGNIGLAMSRRGKKSQ